jgi:Ca2+-transporting ATPase
MKTVETAGAPAWHALAVEQALVALGTELPNGLATPEARRRLRRAGTNRVAQTREIALWRLAARQFRSLVVLLLLAASVVAAAVGEVPEAIAILVALAINAGIGFVTEWRARVSLARLRALAAPQALVRRDGRVTRMPGADVVPGDVLVLETGSHVAADARLIESAGLRVSEATLTGESVPVDKDAHAVLDAGVPLADRRTLVYLGTAVVAGHGVAVVTATGAATELGRIATLVGETGERTTPLEREVEQLGRRLIVVALAICAAVAAIGILRGQPVGLMIETAITLAVAAVPEGLPAIVTIALAAGVWRLGRAGALVRRLPAVETLGATTVICADKTGTMTENRMSVARLELDGRAVTLDAGEFREGERAIDAAADPDVRRLLTVAALVNDAQVEPAADGARLHGDPTETALLAAAMAAGLDPAGLARRWPRRGEIPFTTETRFMATRHALPDGVAWLVKGAPATVLGRCALVQRGDVAAPMVDAAR